MRRLKVTLSMSAAETHLANHGVIHPLSYQSAIT